MGFLFYKSKIYLKYLKAILRAKEGRIMKTVENKSLMNISFNGESGVLGPPAVRIIQMPKIPNNIDAIIKILVVSFCIV